MSALEAVHELRRMAQAVCWRCEGTGFVRRWANDCIPARHKVQCPSCAGTGQPERVAL